MNTFNFLLKSFLPGTPDGGTVFELRADISIIGHLFNFIVTGLYISFDKINLRVFFAFPVMLFMWGVQFKYLLIVTPGYLAALVTLSSFLCSL